MQNTRLKIIVTLFFFIFLNSCSKTVYNEIGFGGNANNAETESVSKQYALKRNSVDLYQNLYKFDTLKNKSELISLKTNKPLKFTDRLMLKLALKNLPKAKFVDDYGNWLKKSFPKKNDKKLKPNEVNKHVKVITKNKANYNEDVVATGFWIAGICVGILLIIYLNSLVFNPKLDFNGCLVLSLLGLVLILGLLVALIGAIMN